MIDRNKESLSALMDGEADELEVRRILNQLDKDDGLRENWKNYHLMGSLMRDESFDSLDLTQGINQALDDMEEVESGDSNMLADLLLQDGLRDSELKYDELKEPSIESVLNVQRGEKEQKRAWYKPLTSVAVAASVTLAVLLGVQSIEPNDGLGLASTNRASMQPSGELTASTLTQEQHQALTQESQKDLENAQHQLQEYVLKQSPESNTGRAGMLPFARVVEFEGRGK